MNREYLLNEIGKYENIIRNEQNQIDQIKEEIESVNDQILTLSAQKNNSPPKKLYPISKNDNLESNNESCQMLQTFHKFLQISGSQTLQGTSKDIYFEDSEQQFLKSFQKDQAIQKALMKQNEMYDQDNSIKNKINTEKKRFITERSFQEDLKHSIATGKKQSVLQNNSIENQQYRESMITSAVSMEESNNLDQKTHLKVQKEIQGIQQIDCVSFLKSYISKQNQSNLNNQDVSLNFSKDSRQQNSDQQEEDNFSNTLDSKLAQKLKDIKIRHESQNESVKSIQLPPEIQSLEISQDQSKSQFKNYSIDVKPNEKISLDDTINYGSEEGYLQQNQESQMDLSDTLIYEDDELNEHEQDEQKENNDINKQQQQSQIRLSLQQSFPRKQSQRQSNVKINFKNSIQRKLEKNQISFDRNSEIPQKESCQESNFLTKNKIVLENFDKFFSKMQNKKINTESNDSMGGVSFNSQIIEEIFKKAKQNQQYQNHNQVVQFSGNTNSKLPQFLFLQYSMYPSKNRNRFNDQINSYLLTSKIFINIRNRIFKFLFSSIKIFQFSTWHNFIPEHSLISFYFTSFLSHPKPFLNKRIIISNSMSLCSQDSQPLKKMKIIIPPNQLLLKKKFFFQKVKNNNDSQT